MVDVSGRAEEVPWSGIREMFNLAAQLPDVVNLSVGEPDYDTPQHIVDAAKRALNEGHSWYTPVPGILGLREAIARKLWRENVVQADPTTEVIVTVGATEGVFVTLATMLDVGDEVIIGDPTYVDYEGQIRLAGGRPIRVSALESNGFKMHPDDIEKAVSKKTKGLIINSPANPTGVVLLQSDLEFIAAIAQRHDLFVLSDEAYEKLVYDGAQHTSIARLPGMKERTISVFTFSKSYAMTGWRLGYVVGPKRVIERMQKMHQKVVSCIPGFIQQAGIAAMDGPQDCVREMVAEYERRRRFVVERLNQINGVTCMKPKGAFYAYANISSLGRTSKEAAVFLVNETKVACVPGSAFGARGDGYLRVSYAASMQQLEEGMMRLEEGVTRFGAPTARDQA